MILSSSYKWFFTSCLHYLTLVKWNQLLFGCNVVSILSLSEFMMPYDLGISLINSTHWDCVFAVFLYKWANALEERLVHGKGAPLSIVRIDFLVEAAFGLQKRKGGKNVLGWGKSLCRGPRNETLVPVRNWDQLSSDPEIRSFWSLILPCILAGWPWPSPFPSMGLSFFVKWEQQRPIHVNGKLIKSNMVSS